MKIKQILNQHRRDFFAIFVCEHCGNEEKASGYDDSYFHKTVIPEMKCKKCSCTAAHNYEPRAEKYPAHQIV
jgi:hypothetical protein